jgi:hypothetical protein
MRTIGPKLRRSQIGTGDYRTVCDYCGAPYYRSELELDSAERLRCRLHGRFRTARELNEANALGAERRALQPEPERRGGRGYAPVDHEAEETYLTDGSSYS